MNPFEDVAPESLEKPYLPPAPGPVPPMEHRDKPDEGRPEKKPEQTGERPVFPRPR